MASGGPKTGGGRSGPFLLGRSASLTLRRLVKLLEDCWRASESVMRGGSMNSVLSLMSRPGASPSRTKLESEAVLVLTRQSRGNVTMAFVAERQTSQQTDLQSV